MTQTNKIKKYLLISLTILAVFGTLLPISVISLFPICFCLEVSGKTCPQHQQYYCNTTSIGPIMIILYITVGALVSSVMLGGIYLYQKNKNKL